MGKPSAHLIKHALSIKHKGDFFLTEVKNGPTWTSSNLLILDAVAIKKSWTKPCITGYEVKVDRGDFRGDEKWQYYLDYCHKFSFVCPKGLIQPDELPEEVGLIWYNPEKKSLYTKRKAAYRTIEISTEMLYYILMSRIENDRHPFFSRKREMLEMWVEDKIARQELAWRIRCKYLEEIENINKEKQKLERECEKLKNKARRFDQIETILNEHGIECGRWDNWEQKLRYQLQNGIPLKANYLITDIKKSLEILEKIIQNKALNKSSGKIKIK